MRKSVAKFAARYGVRWVANLLIYQVLNYLRYLN
jgi:hypothetical protein